MTQLSLNTTGDLKINRTCFSFIDYNQQTNSNPYVAGPQDGGFDTSAWGNYTNYYPVQNQNNNNNQQRGNQRPRSNYQNNHQRQQTSNNSVVVCNRPSKG
jgi:hypothetical protein